jgi:transcriptional regulator
MPERRDFLLGLSSLLSAEGEADSVDTIYIPERHAETDRAFLLDFIEEFSFGMVISSHGGLRASNVPTLLRRPSTIWWHLAKSNPQNAALAASSDVMLVFRGPHAYISPNWYQTKNVVPTWNFAVVHARGKVTRLDSDEAFAQSLSQLVARNEQRYGGGDRWRYNDLPDSYLKGMRQGIVAWQLEIESLEGKFKLGQERSSPDRDGTLEGLKRPQERDILALTRSYYARRPAK